MSYIIQFTLVTQYSTSNPVTYCYLFLQTYILLNTIYLFHLPFTLLNTTHTLHILQYNSVLLSTKHTLIYITTFLLLDLSLCFISCAKQSVLDFFNQTHHIRRHHKVTWVGHKFSFPFFSLSSYIGLNWTIISLSMTCTILTHHNSTWLQWLAMTPALSYSQYRFIWLLLTHPFCISASPKLDLLCNIGSLDFTNSNCSVLTEQ